MKKVWMTSVAALMLTFMAAGAMAQGPRGEKMTPEQRAERMAGRMTEQLSLTKEQSAKIEKIYLDHFKDMPQRPPQGQKGERPAPRDGKPSGDRPAQGPRSERMAKMDSEIKEVLTEEQYKKWSDQRAEMQKKMQERREAHGRAGQPKAE